MRLLILGGTAFLGRYIIRAALARGHALTLFNRGKTNPGLFPDVEQLHGDRNGDLEPLEGHRWDAVIDTSGYLPRIVRQSAELLAGRVDHYTFISSVSIYADFSQPGITEDATVGELIDENVEEITGETYGPFKALCEQAVEEVMPGRSLVIRPGLIVGPHDSSDRFTFWPYRISRGGEVLVPGRPARLVQFIDVRDLASWIIDLIEARQTGTYNATGPAQPMPMADLLEVCKIVGGNDVHYIWVSEQYLLEQNVEAWMDLPLWLPESDPQYAGFFAIDAGKAVDAGLKYRSVIFTVRDTLEWALTRPDDYEWRAGLRHEREAELLALWKQEYI